MGWLISSPQLKTGLKSHGGPIAMQALFTVGLLSLESTLCSLWEGILVMHGIQGGVGTFDEIECNIWCACLFFWKGCPPQLFISFPKWLMTSKNSLRNSYPCAMLGLGPSARGLGMNSGFAGRHLPSAGDSEGQTVTSRLLATADHVSPCPHVSYTQWDKHMSEFESWSYTILDFRKQWTMEGTLESGDPKEKQSEMLKPRR